MTKNIIHIVLIKKKKQWSFMIEESDLFISLIMD